MKLLVVVDMQKDFIDGALGTKEAVAIVPKVAQKIERARADGVMVVFTRDTHQKNYLETQEGKNLPVVHCVEGTDGWQISRKLEVGNSRIFESLLLVLWNLRILRLLWTGLMRLSLLGFAQVSVLSAMRLFLRQSCLKFAFQLMHHAVPV